MTKSNTNKTRSQEMKKRLSQRSKNLLSLMSILILILAFILVPKINKKQEAVYEQPGYFVRRVAAPTPIPEENKTLIVASQAPSRTLTISKVDFKEGGHLEIYAKDEKIAETEMFTGTKEDLDVSLAKETKDGDMVRVVLLSKENKLIASKEILINTTSINPGIILPKDLQ